MRKRNYKRLLLAVLITATLAVGAVAYTSLEQGYYIAGSNAKNSFGRESSIAGSKGEKGWGGRESSIASSRGDLGVARESS